MQGTTSYIRGDIVLVDFVFSDESGMKLRPALIVSSERYHRARQDVITAAITTNVGRRLFGDRAIAGWREAGLQFPSVVTGIVRTVKAPMIRHRLGALQRDDLAGVDQALRGSLGL